MFLHRERDSDKKASDQEGEGSKTSLILAKQRNGAVGTIDIVLLKKYTKFVPMAQEFGSQ
jgi:replicative DNA helicase